MKTIISLLLLISTSVFAGHETGNGGDVVVCKQNDGSQTFELLDLYEMREVHGLKADFDDYYDDIYRKAYHQIDKMESWGKWDEPRKYMRGYYVSKVQKFSNRIKFVQTDLDDIPDSYNTYLPKNCKLKQIAINYHNGLIIIDERIWKKLDGNNKAALIIHEILYEDMIKSGHKDSVVARQLNAFLHGNSKRILNSENRIISDKVNELIISGINYYELKEQLNIIKVSPYLAVKSFLLERLYQKDDAVDTQLLLKFTLEELKKKEREQTVELILLELSKNYINLDFEGIWLPVRTKILAELLEPRDNLEQYKLQLFQKFEFEQNEVEKIFKIYRFQRDNNLYEKYLGYFNEAFVQFKVLPSELFEILTSDIEEMVQRSYRGAKGQFAIKLISKLSERGDELDGKYLEAILDEMRSFRQESDYSMEFKILWNSRLRAEAVKFLNTYLTSQYYYQDGSSLAFLISSFKFYKQKDELLRELEAGISHIFTKFGKYNGLVQSMYHLFRGAKLPLYPLLKYELIKGIKNGMYEPNHYSGMYEVLDILTLENNIDDDVADLLGYLVRFQVDLYGSRYLFSIIKRFDYYTDYLNSTIAVELKRNLSDYMVTKDLLELLENRVLSVEQLDIVEFIAISNPTESIRELAQKIIDQQPI